MKLTLLHPLLLLPALWLLLLTPQASAQTTAFTYQGHLMDNGASANGNYEMQFTLKNALTEGITVGTPQAVPSVNAVNGVFNVTLDFGSGPFDGSNRWVEIGVRPFGSTAPYTLLAPRQQLTSAPQAVRALNAGAAVTAVTATNATNATNLTGTLTAGNIGAGLITGTMLANGTVGTNQLATGSVTTTQLAAGTVAFADLAKPPQSGTVSGSTLDYEFGRADFTVTFPQAYTATPVVTASLAPASALFPADGTVQIRSVSATGFTGRVNAQTSEDIALDPTNNGVSAVSLVAVNGNPAICYVDSTNDDIKFVRAANSTGTSWGDPVVAFNGGSLTSFSTPSMAVVNGNPAITAKDSAPASGNLKFVRATDASGTGWGAAVSVDSSLNIGQFSSLAVVAGFPAVSYYAGSGLDLKYVRATDASGTAWGTPVTIDSTDDVGQYTKLVVVNGNPAISYYDVTNGDLKYVRATNSTGSAWGTPITVASSSDVGQYASMAVVNGNPAISYYDATSGNLKYSRATDANGATWSTATLDSTGDVGQHTSLAVINGFAAISYYDVTNGALKYIRATDAAGSTFGSPVTLDTNGDVGQYTSLIEIGTSPAVSYYDVTNGDLRFRYQNPTTNFNINWIALPP